MPSSNRSVEFIKKLRDLNSLRGFASDPPISFSSADIPGFHKTTFSSYVLELTDLGYVEKLSGRKVGQPYRYKILLEIPENLILKGRGFLRVNTFEKRKPPFTSPRDQSHIATWIKDWINYARWLESELTREKRDHKDLRDWRDRICRTVPDPRAQRFPRSAVVVKV